MFWEDRQTVLISDLHLGKVTHFRKAGIAVPPKARLANWTKLKSIVSQCNPKRVLILGDLFHSELNSEWDELTDLLSEYRSIDFHLVIGNHDILAREWYVKNRFIVHDEVFVEPPFVFSHAPLEESPGTLYNICGHIHPAIVLKGSARQRLRLPCFYFGEHLGLLPAFGAFTGTSTIDYDKKDHVFVIADGSIIKIK